MRLVRDFRDKEILYKYFSKDPVTFAYHIGDLDSFFFDNCRWPAVIADDGEVKETILIYYGLSTPTVMIFGFQGESGKLLQEFYKILPDRFFCHYDKRIRGSLLNDFTEKSLGTHYKMKLDDPNNECNKERDKSILRLNRTHTPELLGLYKREYPDNYFNEKMLDTSKYLGWIVSGKIAGVAGVHVYSEVYRIAALGNIVTESKFRNRGIATALTGALSSELHNEKIMVTLNVKSDNRSAIRCYQKIGFKIESEYEESIFVRK